MACGCFVHKVWNFEGWLLCAAAGMRAYVRSLSAELDSLRPGH